MNLKKTTPFFKTYNILKTYKIKSILAVVLLIAYYLCLPKQLFKDPTATVITSNSGQLLGAQIADDGQWRFPYNDSVPDKFKTCILQFEDEYFYKHPGFNPISIFKALKHNITSGKVKRGGSTITQQVIRLSRKGKSRTYFEKLIELILATRLEFRLSKDNILNLYASYAPFGGNVVGIDAAAWRYFNRNADDLSWAESATLAVLPNAPSLIYPGKNQKRLLEKRNRLLKKLFDNGIIDKLTYELSVSEGLPQKPYPLPQMASHLLQKVVKIQKGKRVNTTINLQLQEQTNSIVKQHYNQLKQNEIYNISVLVLDVKTRNVLSYIGNSPTDKAHQNYVDIIDKPRSTGSILKPFLYAAMLDAGDLLPNTLIADVPTTIGSYQPENFNKSYEGAVFANEALSRSLNVPAVRMLRDFGLDRFYHYLKQLKLKDLKYNANHYGLSLVLGGAESNLWDLCKSYAAMASTLNHYTDNSSQYYTKEFCQPTFIKENPIDFGKLSDEKTVFDAASIYHTFKSMKQVNRPQEDESWEFYNSSQDIAWKTGTSFGFRDAWAIGTTKDYVVGVWVGNADGEGRPGLIGVETAAPLLFDIFDILPKSDWFSKPYDEMVEVTICKKSGYRASAICNDVSQQFIQKSGQKTPPCPFHKLIHLDKQERFQVNSSCESVSDIKSKAWFVLPPLQAFYFKSKNPLYKVVPPYRNDCTNTSGFTMEFIYPNQQSTIFLPKDFDGITNNVILKVAHSKPELELYWYIDNLYVGSTKDIHNIAVLPTSGDHIITVMDELGNKIKQKITIAQ